MTARSMSCVVRHIRGLLASSPLADLTDADLLERFSRSREPAAFAALMTRHGAMVQGVCRRLLHDEHEAEDAFQATFLVLSRSAGAIRCRQSLASWLYGVAHRIATKSRSRREHRRLREHARGPLANAAPADLALAVHELQTVLQEELGRLPEKYRAPLVLCYLDGLTKDEAARRLGWPNGTVCCRVARGRELLRARLTRRGLTLSGSLLITALAAGTVSAALPRTLVDTTVRAALCFAEGSATSAASAEAAALAEETLRGLTTGKLKMMTVVLLMFLVAGGAGLMHTGTEVDQRRDAHGTAVAGPAEDAAARPWRRFAHGVHVAAVAFSPDGKSLVSAGGFKFGSLRLWDVANDNLLWESGEVSRGVSSLAFAPDGKLLATGDWNGDVVFWDAATGRKIRRLATESAGVTCVTFSPDGKVLAAASAERSISLRDATTGVLVRQFDVAPRPAAELVALLAFSSDGKSLAALELSGESGVRVLDVSRGKEQHRCGKGHRIVSIAFSPSGKTLAWQAAAGNRSCVACHSQPIGEPEESIHLRDLTTGRERHWLTGRRLPPDPFDAVTSSRLSFSADGRTLASVNVEQGVTLWEVATGEERNHIPRNPRGTTCLSFSPDGTALATGGGDGSAAVWDVVARPRGGPRPADLSTKELEALWKDLLASDARTAYRAVTTLIHVPGQAVPFLRECLKKPTAVPTPQQISGMIADLDSNQFAVRQNVTEGLESLGMIAEAPLKEALAAKPSLELRQRIERLLALLTKRGTQGEELRRVRALEVLEHINTAAARDVIAAVAEGQANLLAAAEAKASLERLGKRWMPSD